MPKSVAKPHLELCQVLEEEYEALHGPLPSGYRKDTSTQDRLSSIYQLIHQHPQQRSALCLSGGGIRSATFALGVLQGLARHGLLGRFDYLSTVSGGGYMGSWLTAWIHRDGLREAIDQIKGESEAKFDPEPAPIRHLRTYSNYLSPKLGLLSADTWTLVGTYLRNLLLNWTVLIPLLLAVLMIPRIGVAVISEVPGPWWRGLALGLGFVGAVMAIAYMGVNRPSASSPRQAQSRFLQSISGQGGFLICCLVPLLLSAVLLTTYWAWHQNLEFSPGARLGWGSAPITWLDVVLFGVAVHLLAWAVYSLWLRRFRVRKLLVTMGEFIVTLATGAVGGALVWWGAKLSCSHLRPSEAIGMYVSFATPLFLGVFLLAATIFVGVASHWTDDEDREWWARAGAWILIAVVVWSAFSSLVLIGPHYLGRGVFRQAIGALGGLSGLATLLLGRSIKTPANKDLKEPRDWKPLLAEKALLLAAPVFLVILAVGLAEGSTWLFRRLGVASEWGTLTFRAACGLGLGMAATGLAMSWLVNANKFSLHGMYRNRLIRAYLGASNKDRQPNPFTGFDPTDNIQMHQFWPDDQSGKRKGKLLHVVNVTLNLVSGDQLAWQQRKAATFTITPLHSGNGRLGYRRSKDYGKHQDRAITLGTAMAISGAAVSPNMGYHSSPVVAFVLTLFNARLGWWLGNPGTAGDRTYQRANPRFSVGSLLAEAFGMTDEHHPYVYLSDGGHFENLGLYEMVLRRCGFIVVSDASCDPEFTFEDLGNAVRKIRVDLGVPIEFEQGIFMGPWHDGAAKGEQRHCAIGRIGYSEVDKDGKDGVLVYIKPVICGSEPRDVLHYAEASPSFPHESTGDQWFSEVQFERYRALGLHAVEQLCGEEWAGRELGDFERAAGDYLGKSAP